MKTMISDMLIYEHILLEIMNSEYTNVEHSMLHLSSVFGKKINFIAIAQKSNLLTNRMVSDMALLWNKREGRYSVSGHMQEVPKVGQSNFNPNLLQSPESRVPDIDWHNDLFDDTWSILTCLSPFYLDPWHLLGICAILNSWCKCPRCPRDMCPILTIDNTCRRKLQNRKANWSAKSEQQCNCGSVLRLVYAYILSIFLLHNCCVPPLFHWCCAFIHTALFLLLLAGNKNNEAGVPSLLEKTDWETKLEV